MDTQITVENQGLMYNLRHRFTRLGRDIARNKTSYLFLAPYAIIFITFTVLPVLVSIILSFTHYNMLEKPVWIGWQNYLKLFLSDDVFLIAVKNTFVFAAITGPV